MDKMRSVVGEAPKGFLEKADHVQANSVARGRFSEKDGLTIGIRETWL